MPATENNATEKSAAAGAGMGGKTVVEAAPDMEYPVALHTVVVRDAAAALQWYEKALDAKVGFRYDDAEGRVMHAVLQTSFGMMLGVEDYYPKMHMVSPAAEGGEGAAAGSSYVYITIPKGKGSADAAIERMREAGATVVMEPEDKFYGSRMGQVVDQYGVAWAFSHKIEKKEKEDAPGEKEGDGEEKKE